MGIGDDLGGSDLGERDIGGWKMRLSLERKEKVLGGPECVQISSLDR